MDLRIPVSLMDTYLQGQGGKCKNASASHIRSTRGKWPLLGVEAKEHNIHKKPDTISNRYTDFWRGTRLAMPKTICALDSSSLKPGLGATEGVLD